MLCPACNNFRPSNNAPCPWCNALSPLASNAWSGQDTSPAGNENQSGLANSWGGPVLSNDDWGTLSGQLNFPSTSWQNPAGSGAQQPAFSSLEQSAFAQQQADNPFWSQSPAAAEQGSKQSRELSLLPVPYQDPANQQSFMAMPTGFPTLGSGIQPVNSLAPALPDTGQEATVYVPPMYTKPRPIIPRYRAISGLISVIIVGLLLCSGTAYFAQVTGKLTGLEKLLGFYTPPAVAQNAAHPLPVPTTQVMYNTPSPAAKVITSVGLSNKVSTSGLIPVYVNKFTVGDTVYLTCGTNTSQAGVVTVWWYTNNSRYHEQITPIPAKSAPIVEDHIVFGQPGEDKAEIYWNNELAATVLFVVEPAA